MQNDRYEANSTLSTTCNMLFAWEKRMDERCRVLDQGNKVLSRQFELDRQQLVALQKQVDLSEKRVDRIDSRLEIRVDRLKDRLDQNEAQISQIDLNFKVLQGQIKFAYRSLCFLMVVTTVVWPILQHFMLR
jgi:septal ring factor EnvC (AmiA/AmiB activator)